jgi:hypothetical protein
MIWHHISQLTFREAQGPTEVPSVLIIIPPSLLLLLLLKHQQSRLISASSTAVLRLPARWLLWSCALAAAASL